MIIYTAGSVRDINVDADELAGLTWFGHALWFADPSREHAVPIDPASGEVGDPVPCPGLRAGLTTIGGNLLYGTDGAVLRLLDPRAGAVIRDIQLSRQAEVTGLEAIRDGLWIGYRDALEFRRLADLELINTIRAPFGVNGVTVTDRYVAYSDCLGEAITVHDTVPERDVLQIHVHGRPTGLAWDGLRIWFCDAANIRLRALDVPGMVGG